MRFALTIVLALISTLVHPAAGDTKVDWQDWSNAAFEQAAREDKLVLLEMEAVWCHWCHVMDKETYSRQDVADAIHANYIPIRVDHDARPDLANRYREWGWPATIILKADGTELVKRAGYIAPQPFLRLLAAVVADPTPEAAARLSPPPLAAGTSLSKAVKAELQKRHVRTSDMDKGALKIAQKFIEPGALEYALALSVKPDTDSDLRQQETTIARKTLDGALNLVDPVWGGIYQYSTGGDWQTPHYEKLAFVQARYLRLYSLGWAAFKQPEYAAAAKSIVRYMKAFLRDDSGAFYSSQDADLIPGEKSSAYFALNDQGRRAKGIPRIDKNIYARENGLMAEALLRWYQYSAEQEGLQLARDAIVRIRQSHQLPSGGFTHAAGEKALFLEDQLAMAKALLALYEVTAERQWLSEAIKVSELMDARFRHQTAGWLDAPSIGPLTPLPGIDQNIASGRFFNRLYHFTGDSRWQAAAEHAMKFLAAESVALSRLEETGLLLFDLELNTPPLHYTVVAAKADELASKQFFDALSDPVAYKRVEWWDRSEGPLMHDDVPYPSFPMTAAYVCNEKRCSAPAFDMKSWQLRRQGLVTYP